MTIKQTSHAPNTPMMQRRVTVDFKVFFKSKNQCYAKSYAELYDELLN